MIRKMLCGILAVMLALSGVLAIAESDFPGVTSPTLPETISADSITTAENETAEGLLIDLSVIEEETPAEKLFEDIQAAVLEQPIFDYLGKEVLEDASQFLEGKDANDFILAEMWRIRVFSSQELPEVAKAVYHFPADYPKDTPLIGLVGILGEEAVAWTAVAAEAEEGQVKVVFVQEILQQIMESENAVFILLQEEI